MRRTLVAALFAALLAGCGDPSGESGGATSTFREADVPFTFRHPAEFVSGKVDRGATRGEVLGIRAIDKVNLLGVRRVDSAAAARLGVATRQSQIGGRTVTLADVPHTVSGHAVVSQVAFFDFGNESWELECQYTADRRTKVLDACHQALTTLAPRR